MTPPTTVTTVCTAFADTALIASGELGAVALKTKDAIDRNKNAAVLIFDDGTGAMIELDLRGTADDVLKRLAAAEPVQPAPTGPRGPGRPRLGVVAREVTLLPRHWEWLSAQPGGASVALRRLVEEARRTHKHRDRVRQTQEAAYRFMSAMAGNAPGFEEAARALFAGNETRFDELIAKWPPDVRDHVRRLAGPAFAPPATAKETDMA